MPQAHFINPDKLSWDDYHGTKGSKTAGTAAQTIIHFDTLKGKIIDIKVGVLFYSDSSYVNWRVLYTYGKTYQDNLLSHEKYHYKQAILYAKKLQIYFDKNHIISRNRAVLMMSEFDKSRVIEDSIYDAQTDGGEKCHIKQACRPRSVAISRK